MARRTTVRNSTVLKTLKTQKDEVLSFNKHLEVIEKFINTKVSRVIKLDTEGSTRVYELDTNILLLQQSVQLTKFNIDSAIEEKMSFQSEILEFSQGRDKIFVLFANSWKILSLNFDEILSEDYEAEFRCGKINKRAKFAVTGDQQGNLLIWDLLNEERGNSVKAYECAVVQVGISESRKLIVSLGENKTLMVWKKDLQLIIKTDMKSKIIMKVVEDFIFFSDRVMRINKSEIIVHFELLKQSMQFQVTALSVSPDKNYLAVYDNKLSIYELSTNLLKFRHKCKITDVVSICFSKDSFRVYIINNERVEVIKLFEDFNNRKIKTLETVPNQMTSNGPHVYFTDSEDIYHYEDSSGDFNILGKGRKLIIVSQSDLSKTSVLPQFNVIDKKEEIELKDLSQEGSATDRRVRKKGNSNYDRIMPGFSLTDKKTSLKIYGKKFSVIVMNDRKVEIFSGDDSEGKILHVGGNFSVFAGNDQAFLVYDGVEVKVFEIYPMTSQIFSLVISDVKDASLNLKYDCMILRFENCFELHYLNSERKKMFSLPDVQRVEFYNTDSNFYTITTDCKVQVYELEDTFPQGSFQVHNKTFTGCSSMSRSMFLLLSSEYGIEVCSLQDFCHLSTIPIVGLTLFSLSVRDKKIYYCCSNIFFSMTNPLENSSFEPILLNFSDFSFDTWKWISALINNDRTLNTLSSVREDFLIMPFCISQVLLLANSGQKLLLKKAIRAGSRYLRYQNPTLTPLTLAICRRNKDIIACLMKEIIYAASFDENVFIRVENDLIELNYKGSNRNLSYFYQNIFHEPSHEHDSLAALKAQPFVAVLSPTKEICNTDFLMPSSTDPDLVEFRVSALRFSIQEFSRESVEFLDSIIWSASPEILKTPIIQAILLHKWNQVRFLIYFQLAVFTGYLLILTLFISSARNEPIVVICLLILNTFFLVCELPLILYGPLNYILDAWNVLDSSRIVLFYFFSSVFFLQNDRKNLLENISLLAIILLSWIRGLAFFRIFKRTRYLIRIIIEVFIDVVPFIVVLFYCILSFAFVGYSLDGKSTFTKIEDAYMQLVDEWSIQYLLNFGDFDTKDYSFVDLIQFFGSSVLNTLIMMSMIIALMGNTYERVEESAMIAEYKEMASYVLEIESMLLWMHIKSKKNFFQFCFSRTKLEIGEEEEVVDEKIKKIKEKVVGFVGEFQGVREETEKGIMECKEILNSSFEQSGKQIEEIFAVAKEFNDQIRGVLKTPRGSIK